MTYISKTARFTFSTYLGAVEALIETLEDARTTRKTYRITGITPKSILANGLLLTGEIDEISEKISGIIGATRHDY